MNAKQIFECRRAAFLVQASALFSSGIAAPELKERFGIPESSLYRILNSSVMSGELFCNGALNKRRYFSDKTIADAFCPPTNIERAKPIMAALPKAKRLSVSWSSTEAKQPDGLKITYCHCGKDTRFEVSSDYVGEFQRLGPGRYVEEHAQ